MSSLVTTQWNPAADEGNANAAPIPLNDLKHQYHSLRNEIDEAIGRVVASGRYLLGPPASRSSRHSPPIAVSASASGSPTAQMRWRLDCGRSAAVPVTRSSRLRMLGCMQQ